MIILPIEKKYIRKNIKKDPPLILDTTRNLQKNCKKI